MKKLVIAITAAFALSGVAMAASAQSHSNASSGGGNWHGGGSWHGGGDRHGDFHHGGGRFGLSFGFPAFYSYWGPGYYYPYAYAYPYPYAYYDGYSYDDGAPQVYIQRDSGDAVAPPSAVVPPSQPRRSQYSYYCTDPAGYYPQIGTCPSGWLTVVPNGSPRAAPAPR